MFYNGRLVLAEGRRKVIISKMKVFPLHFHTTSPYTKVTYGWGHYYARRSNVQPDRSKWNMTRRYSFNPIAKSLSTERCLPTLESAVHGSKPPNPLAVFSTPQAYSSTAACDGHSLPWVQYQTPNPPIPENPPIHVTRQHISPKTISSRIKAQASCRTFSRSTPTSHTASHAQRPGRNSGSWDRGSCSSPTSRAEGLSTVPA
jgi:hypothetical protein